MVYLDSNILIRFFTNDDPKKALKVKQLLKKEKEITISDVVFPELEYVLTGLYKITKKELVSIFKFLTSQNNIKINNELKEATAIFEKKNLDIVDCIIAAYSLKGKLASFDDDLLKVKNIQKYW